ncbi:DEAD/DEAH box helicase [Nonlabens xiamenensis]|uniref:DEAD/DEAH box helicase n=1 Tax=Nonlabens xiamenensis TaxID=2341043 RepID=UPI000F6106C2|nr:DEAD/DEAH box helicase [Nonlabens xiamenensis]
MSFNDWDLPAPLLQYLQQQGHAQPTPIQQQAIPEVLKGRDLMGIAPTGSGKTLAYALPLLQGLKDIVSKNRQISGLVLVPTRELAEQVGQVIIDLAKQMDRPLITMAVYGGVSVNVQMMNMNKVDILVATPGRLIDLMDSNAVSLAACRVLVMDEADKMLSMGFRDEVDYILNALPQQRQNLLFSATLNPQVEQISGLLLSDPAVIEIKTPKADLSQIKQLGYRVVSEKKGVLLRHLIHKMDMQQVMIFCSSTYQVEHVNDKLNTNGIKSKAIHGKKSQSIRNNNLADFKQGAVTGVQCLVTTDLLARGIDIEFMPYVINYELPRSPKDYIHRIGRTGRADRTGVAISLVSPEEAHHMRIIQKKTGQKVWMEDLEEWNS